MSNFTVGQKVKSKTSRGREVSGVVEQVVSTTKGDWISVKQSDGTIAKVRPGNTKAA